MSKKRVAIDDLLQEYRQLETPLRTLMEAMAPILSSLAEEREVKLGFPLQQRVKTWESILDKIRSQRINVNKTLLELQDLMGLRLVTLFAADLDPLADALGERFDLLKRYYTGDRLEYDQFGYNSLHLIVSVPVELGADFAWRKPPRAEIQLRTLSQHVWAETSNLFQYKQEADVPRILKRAFGRVAALLETVDIELDRVRQERAHYRDSILDSLPTDELNVDSLQRLLEARLPRANAHSADDYADLHRILLALGIDSRTELSGIIDQRADEILALDREVAELFDERADSDRGFMTHTGLVKLMLNEHLGMHWEQAMAGSVRQGGGQ